jgi:hypothetical protein
MQLALYIRSVCESSPKMYISPLRCNLLRPCAKAAFLSAAASAIAPLSRDVFCWDLFRELLGLLLCLRTELLGLVDGSVGTLLDLIGGLAELALGSAEAILSLELESLLTATHAVLMLVSGLMFAIPPIPGSRGLWSGYTYYQC